MAGIPTEVRPRGELPARRRSPARVLVVEDEPQLASLYAAYLEREGITPQLVDSGAAALQLRDGAVKGVNLARTLRQARAALSEGVMGAQLASPAA